MLLKAKLSSVESSQISSIAYWTLLKASWILPSCDTWITGINFYLLSDVLISVQFMQGLLVNFCNYVYLSTYSVLTPRFHYSIENINTKVASHWPDLTCHKIVHPVLPRGMSWGPHTPAYLAKVRVVSACQNPISVIFLALKVRQHSVPESVGMKHFWAITHRVSGPWLSKRRESHLCLACQAAVWIVCDTLHPACSGPAATPTPGVHKAWLERHRWWGWLPVWMANCLANQGQAAYGFIQYSET